MRDWEEQAAIREWVDLKKSAEHYERLQANAEQSTHSDAALWAIEWRLLAEDKRRQMALVLERLPAREEDKEAA